MKNESFWIKIIYAVSILISLTVAFLILGPRPDGIEGRIDVSFFPIINASLNGVTTILLLVGYYLIRNKMIKKHKIVMLTAFGTSSLFLVSYVVYHWFKSGPKLYAGNYETIYFMILITHIILAAIIIPLSLFTLYHSLTNQIDKHRKIAKVTFPVWLYVSVTGVIIYYMLYN